MPLTIVFVSTTTRLAAGIDHAFELGQCEPFTARLIHKVYEVDPLICPVCKGPMHIIALIENADVIRRILTHLGRWSPREEGQRERAPPVKADGANLELTYYPVPDIA